MEYTQHSSVVIPSIASIVVAFTVITARHFIKSRQRHPFPPGPRALPFVGNLFDMDWNQPWVTFSEWSKAHGDLVHSKLFGLRIITLHSEDLIRDLFDKRSTKYSDRVALATVAPYGADFSTPTIRYGDAWRFHRRLYHHVFRTESATVFRSMQAKKAHELLLHVLEAPKDFYHHMHRFGAAVVMSATYDYDVTPHDSTLEMVQTAVEKMISSPEKATFVDTFPFCRYIPAWFPRVGYFNAQQCREACWKMKMEPYQDMLARIRTHSNVRKYVSHQIFSLRSNRFAASVVMSALYGYQASPTASVLFIFVLAMVLNPDVQNRAYAEIIHVCGSDRLPTFEDRPRLRYVEAVVRETLRWCPIAPLGIPHSTTDDDVYEGQFIPKGMGICRDEARYHRAAEFIPERFLTEDGTLTNDTVDFVFGFGRRICPGKHLANASLWIAIASLLAVFRFEKAKDDNGMEVDFVPEWSSGSTSYPEPFPCHILPRFPHREISRLS
ncbi:cytochrome P450 [Coniophora puteana RWD-64-598 SS2]|uniref:Cytochrome P450 n=1 Tax=Coniophora puteana (strain RWD-64-598) TaxID=741705 RepID=A0A5M3MZE9_CONPW|nr:cytochrome P450 [Coniophora puteana RWD-64-598 SS2]EIW84509.1 cytochrome P450 [Coniophora puteana RWD-64-598 SS2]